MHTSQTSPGTGELAPTVSRSLQKPCDTALSAWCSSAGKRVFDVVLSAIALLAAWPVMLVVAAAIKVSSRGPILFRQKRVGRSGRLFELMKFRSMRIAAENSGPRITSQGDPRILPLGRFLRKSKLDELPQLFNVIRGEMGLVGPRPDLPEFCASLRGNDCRILELRPGITGAATLVYRHEEQLLAGRDCDGIGDYYVSQVYPDKVQLDLQYARKATLAGDLRILLRTIGAIFS